MENDGKGKLFLSFSLFFATLLYFSLFFILTKKQRKNISTARRKIYDRRSGYSIKTRTHESL